MSQQGAEVVLVRPAIDAFLADGKESLWPSHVLNATAVHRASALRSNLLRRLDELFEDVPVVMELTDAIERGLVTEKSAVETFDLLTEFLDADAEHRRLILYLPLEIIPSADWHPASEALDLAVEGFTRSYMRGWRELVEESDVRANFVDGNILEPELAPNGQSLVRKAAHLIPTLMRKAHISLMQTLDLWDSGTNDVLRDSIADAIPALVPLRLLSSGECERILRERLYPTPTSTPRERKARVFEAEWFDSLQERVEHGLRQLDMRKALDDARGLPPARVAWERVFKEDVLVSEFAERIADSLATARLQHDAVMQLITRTSGAARTAVLRGVGSAVEQLAQKEVGIAQNLVALLLSGLKPLAFDASIRDELESVLSRAYAMKAATREQLRLHGFDVPRLDATFDETSDAARDIERFEGSVRAMLKKYEHWFYPVAIFFGSRLKGYAKRNADLDAAVCVRPGVSLEERPKIQEALKALFPDKRIGGKIVEFWLEEGESELSVRDFPEADVFLADSTWVHLLLTSVWLGEESAITELYEKLLPGFLRESKSSYMGRPIRRVWLREMERDILQYRLMHKGYRRFYPPQGGMGSDGTEGLDGSSVFWDSGYRRLATKLFVSRVFLPQMRG